MTGYDGIRQSFLTALADPEVNGICTDIDSPGGEVAGCFDPLMKSTTPGA